MAGRKPRDLRRLYRKLVANPFFPLLFISEFVKTAVVVGHYTPRVGSLFALAVVATTMWILSDNIEEAID